MNNALTEIAFVLDRSGSMGPVAGAAMQGFNDFLRDQQAAPGQARLTVVLFDDEYLLHVDSVPVSEVLPLTIDTYLPRGSTALLDAIGRTIDTLGARLGRLPEPHRPGQVIVAILTDGLENASTAYTFPAIAQRIRHQRSKYAWEFLFLGANQDAIATASQLHIPAANSASYQADAIGAASPGAAISRKTRSLRASKIAGATPQDLSDLTTPMSELVQEEDARRRGK